MKRKTLLQNDLFFISISIKQRSVKAALVAEYAKEVIIIVDPNRLKNRTKKIKMRIKQTITSMSCTVADKTLNR